MAIGVAQLGTKVNGTTSVASLTQPGSVANGHVLLAFIVDHATSGSSAAPTGWTWILGAGGTGGRAQVFKAVVGKGGLTGTSWTFSGLTTRSLGKIVGYSGVDNANPFDCTGSYRVNASGASGTTSITPVTNGNKVVAGFAALPGAYTWSAEAVATSPTIAELSDEANSTYCSLAICDGVQTTAGATGVSSGTPSTAGANVGLLVALRPALAPTVTTQTTTNVGSTTATGNGNVTADGGNDVSERGHVWNTTGNPTTADTKVTSGTGTGAYTSTLINLPANTLIYVNSYAINPVGTSYGTQDTFTTLAGGQPAGTMMLLGVGP